MCGIVGYLGKKRAAPILLKGLKRLEYRGYDSAGIATLEAGRLNVFKRSGHVEALRGAEALGGTIGIGHTRWATHGAPDERNAHPHVYGRFTIVHNGIIENALALRAECEGRGEKFSSETDSEVIAHLLEYYYRGDLLEALDAAVSRLKGSYAIAALCIGEERIAVAREKSPLVLGKGEGLFVASDIPAIAAECGEIYALADGERAILGPEGMKLYVGRTEIAKKPLGSDLSGDVPSKKGYRHYMRKEIDEIPAAIADSIVDFGSNPRFSDLYRVLCQTEYLQIIACGTAYHSGIAAEYAVESLARVPVEVCVASEYRYRDPIVPPCTLAVAVSQSGETADTLAAAKLAKERGATLLAVTNAPASTLTGFADFTVVTQAGREIAVAATKSFNAQLAVLYSLAIALASAKGRRADLAVLDRFPALAAQTIAASEKMREHAAAIAASDSVYFIGRDVDYCAALEGSLKLKEISYLASEGYPAGELKHGTLALIREGTPVVAVITRESLAEKTMNAVSEVCARGGRVFLVTDLPACAARREIAGAVLLPPCEECFSPILSVIPLQMLAYYAALERGNDPDKPRNLAKSVTVE